MDRSAIDKFKVTYSPGLVSTSNSTNIHWRANDVTIRRNSASEIVKMVGQIRSGEFHNFMHLLEGPVGVKNCLFQKIIRVIMALWLNNGTVVGLYCSIPCA
jgi:hypothetical protein